MGISEWLRSVFGGSNRVPEQLSGSELTYALVDERRNPRPAGDPASDEPPGRPYFSADEAADAFAPDERGNVHVAIREGFFFHPPTGKYAPPGNRTLSKHGLVSFKVRGVAFYSATQADTSPGLPARLVREPSNEHDPNAIAIWALNRSGQAVKVGYVNRGRARSLAKRMDAGEVVEAYFMRGDRPGSSTSGPPAVILTTGDRMVKLLSDADG
ncbi:HIRAN domain-containing protein [Citricoccus sp. I39-566]|uniref:HIRAN domain-containing protein n=1 Tax=Citricoccus sp. I39-566 TaxID=3073268 RepID=UPI0037C1532F